MLHFDKAFDITMGHEGGYANHPSDTGGETYKGIARNHNPNWSGWAIVDSMKIGYEGEYVDQANISFDEYLGDDKALQGLVRQLYKEKYFDPYDGDEMPELLACEMFDTAVNMGVGTVVKFLQEALNLLNRNERLHDDITVDGGFGPNTQRCLNHFIKSKTRNEAVLTNMLNWLQAEKYLSIIRKKPDQEIFLNAWSNRVRIIVPK